MEENNINSTRPYITSMAAYPLNQRLSIPVTDKEKQKIKFVAVKSRFGNCSTFIRWKILNECDEFIRKYKEKKEKIKQNEPTPLLPRAY